VGAPRRPLRAGQGRDGQGARGAGLMRADGFFWCIEGGFESRVGGAWGKAAALRPLLVSPFA
jgi:hypothetical protein